MAVPTREDYKIDLSGTILEPPPGLDPDCLLFLGDPTMRTYTPFRRFFFPVGLCVGMGLFSVMFNHMKGIPYRAGIHKHFISSALGLALGEGAWRFSLKFTAEKDLQYYHYMVLHPEDFQAPERKKYADVIRPWVPVR